MSHLSFNSATPPTSCVSTPDKINSTTFLTSSSRTEASSVKALSRCSRASRQDTTISSSSRPKIVIPHLLDQDIGDMLFRGNLNGQQIVADMDDQIEEDLNDQIEEED